MVLVRYNNVKKEMEAGHRNERTKVDRESGKGAVVKRSPAAKSQKIDLTYDEKIEASIRSRKDPGASGGGRR